MTKNPKKKNEKFVVTKSNSSSHNKKTKEIIPIDPIDLITKNEDDPKVKIQVEIASPLIDSTKLPESDKTSLSLKSKSFDKHIQWTSGPCVIALFNEIQYFFSVPSGWYMHSILSLLSRLFDG